MSTAYNKALENHESARYLEDLLSRYDDNSLSAGYKQQLRDAAGSEASWEFEREEVLDNIEAQLKKAKLNGYQKAQVQELIANLDNAKTFDEYYSLADRYADVISDVRNVAKDLSTDEIKSNIANNNYQASYSANELASLINQKQNDYNNELGNPSVYDNEAMLEYYRKRREMEDVEKEISKLKSMANNPKEGKTYKIGNKTYYYSKGKFYQL